MANLVPPEEELLSGPQLLVQVAPGFSHRWESVVTCRGQGFRRWGRDRGLGDGGRPVVQEVGKRAVVQQVGGRGRN